MTAPPVEKLALLRAPFDANQVGKLPKNVAKEGQARTCNVCGGWHKPASVHLDYVGHAAVTDRLLDVDPLWTWEPAAVDEQGSPILARNGTGVPIGLWIKLTICGVTRWGYGSCDPGKTEAVKELIGDAIRNAAMRFGVALDLWHKGDLHDSANSETDDVPASQAAPDNGLGGEWQRLLDAMSDKNREAALAAWKETNGDMPFSACQPENAKGWLDYARGLAPAAAENAGDVPF